MITAHGVEKAYGPRRVLDRLDLAVTPGVVTLLVGANGAGKTTLLRIITGLCQPDAGEVQVAGHPVTTRRMEALHALAFLPQAPRFHPRLTTEQVARYYARLRGRSDELVRHELSRWGLDEHLRSGTAQLSGGLRQRLAIAIFFLAQAPVLVLDEPGLSLDPEWRVRLQLHLTAEAHRGATVLIATHLLGEWEGKVDRCVLLDNGRISGALPPNRLRESFPMPQHAAAP